MKIINFKPIFFYLLLLFAFLYILLFKYFECQNLFSRHIKNKTNSKKVFTYNRNTPLIFITGIPGSGLDLMKELLNEQTLIRCSEDTELISFLIKRRNEWTKSNLEKERLKHAKINDQVIDSAMVAFILEMLLKQDKLAPNICNKDKNIYDYMGYMKNLFPKVKFIFMIRDGRATVASLLKKNIIYPKISKKNHKEALSDWNKVIEETYSSCVNLEIGTCLPLFYENLVLDPDSTVQKIFDFLEIDDYHISTKLRTKLKKQRLFNWMKSFSEDLLHQTYMIAPIMSKLGYADYSNTSINLIYSNLIKFNI